MTGFAFWWLLLGWIAWFGVIGLHGARQPKRRTVVSRPGASRAGFSLQTAAALLPWLFRTYRENPPSDPRVLVVIVLVPFSVWAAWLAVRELGKQWRINAALLPDHELIRTGPYRIVRHPVYSSYFTMIFANALLISSWPVIVASSALFLVGTEIRVRAEDQLLAQRFGEQFETYRRKTRAYLPLVR